MKNGIADMLQAAVAKRSKQEKQAALKEVVSYAPQAMTILKYMFKDSIIFILPEGTPPYKKAEKREDLQTALYAELRKLKNFMRGELPNLTAMRREQLFVQLLEALDPNDAELIIAMKDKISPYKNLTKRLVMETFPDQTVGW